MAITEQGFTVTVMKVVTITVGITRSNKMLNVCSTDELSEHLRHDLGVRAAYHRRPSASRFLY
ncbi:MULTISPECIES: hypothetical protein [unclassified Salinivibrio]|uniref:hypothetical protein n=1 Tax=unclassified Salinivibrio TaxID=2636825 RepID=UPI000987223D|nr:MULTISPECIES: hypothetical protein [unclassified Salinivibrio]OOF08958.1 hypothetical protein BZG83_15540 [Salinivibrio sp. PR919]OOF10581.1 hypothetical protein BZG82_07385 [Salinivibrio sp. PR5]